MTFAGARKILRPVALAVGLGLAIVCIRAVGFARVAEALGAAGPWLPLVVALEVGIVATDWAALRATLGPDVPPRAWLEGMLAAYGVGIVAPGGRAAGEAVRATILAPHVGGARAARAGAGLQVASLLAIATQSALLAGLLAARAPRSLVLALLANAGLCCVVAVVLDAVASHRRVLARLAPEVAFGSPLRLSGYPWCLAGRGLQVVQYGVVVQAVGGTLTAVHALAAQAIHLVGATVGDAIPNQVGAAEGAYGLFADALGVVPARAVAIALVVRAAQLSLAVLAFGASFLLRRPVVA